MSVFIAIGDTPIQLKQIEFQRITWDLEELEREIANKEKDLEVLSVYTGDRVFWTRFSTTNKLVNFGFCKLFGKNQIGQYWLKLLP